jgi:hypothetical protein
MKLLKDEKTQWQDCVKNYGIFDCESNLLWI